MVVPFCDPSPSEDVSSPLEEIEACTVLRDRFISSCPCCVFCTHCSSPFSHATHSCSSISSVSWAFAVASRMDFCRLCCKNEEEKKLSVSGPSNLFLRNQSK